MNVSFFVPGTPRPQGSKRAFVNRHTGRATMVEQGGANLTDWRGDVKRAAMEAMNGAGPMEGPLLLNLIFFMTRPKSHPKTKITYPVSRPDIDKLARSCLDAMTSVCFADDAQIISLHAYKVWGTMPGVDLYLTSNQED